MTDLLFRHVQTCFGKVSRFLWSLKCLESSISIIDNLHFWSLNSKVTGQYHRHLPKRSLKLDILRAQNSAWWAKIGWMMNNKYSSQIYFTKKILFRSSRKFLPIFFEICIFRILATQILFILALGRLHPLS